MMAAMAPAAALAASGWSWARALMAATPMVLETQPVAKPATIKIRLNSSADTGFFYVTKKNPRTQTEKLVLKKYDPVVRKHVEFKEGKLKEGFLPIGKNRIEKARSDAPGLLLLASTAPRPAGRKR